VKPIHKTSTKLVERKKYVQGTIRFLAVSHPHTRL
jgi:hypothetical protein